MPRQKKYFWTSKKKLTKNKGIPIHGDLGSDQNRVVDMANFETNFLSKS